MNPVATTADQLGPYRLLSSLGKGGMAEVWKAEHRHLGQVRALKVLLPAIAERPDLVSRLLAEARATARLRHPAIVEVFDCDVLGSGTAFIAMEYLRGEHLRAWLNRIGKLAAHPRLAAAILGTLADGLAFAHRQGVVHRDLKPENVFLVPLAPDGPEFAIKVLDFGIAKLLREEAPTKTRPGCVVGTPTYMAPEQWQPGAPVDQRTDIYALGCLFFELLSGGPPFPYLDDLTIMRAHLSQSPPGADALQQAVPPALGQLLAAMLAKAPEDRPQTMDEIVATLAGFLRLDRTRFGELLRAPKGFLVSLTDVPGNNLPANDATKLGMGSWHPERVGPTTPTFIADTGGTAGQPPRHRRARLIVAASLAVLGVSAFGLLTVLRKPAAVGQVEQVRPAPARSATPAPTLPAPESPAPDNLPVRLSPPAPEAEAPEPPPVESPRRRANKPAKRTANRYLPVGD